MDSFTKISGHYICLLAILSGSKLFACNFYYVEVVVKNSCFLSFFQVG